MTVEKKHEALVKHLQGWIDHGIGPSAIKLAKALLHQVEWLHTCWWDLEGYDADMGNHSPENLESIDHYADQLTAIAKGLGIET